MSNKYNPILQQLTSRRKNELINDSAERYCLKYVDIHFFLILRNSTYSEAQFCRA